MKLIIRNQQRLIEKYLLSPGLTNCMFLHALASVALVPLEPDSSAKVEHGCILL